ncbi:MAG: type II secretion system protein GspL [Robiginitomaculum sp.]|nr:type II secretion system protein GspL [Robiginitomaculum sp.]
MSDLIVIIGHKPTDPWEWGLTATGQAGQAMTGAEKSALKTHSFNRLIAVLPGQQVSIKLHTLGQLNEKQKRQAAGFSIEDELAASLDKNHIALDAGGTRLAIVANKVMDNVIAGMAEYGLAPDIICADYDSFASADSFTYKGRIVQRAGNGIGFAVETDLASAILDAGQNIPPEIDTERFLQKIATALEAGHAAINLRQGDYTKRGAAGLGGYKRSALIAAGIVMAFALGNILQGYNTGQKTKALKAQISEIYTDVFPSKDVPDNPAKAILRAQSDMKKANKQEFIKLSALLATSVRKVEGVEIASLRYEAAKSQLSLSINYLSFDDVERLKRFTTANGGAFSESGTRQSGDGLSGDAVLRLKP